MIQWLRRRGRPFQPDDYDDPPSLPRVGATVQLQVLGAGRVAARVQRVDMLSQEGMEDLAWRVFLRLPDGSAAEGIVRGNSRMCFLDPRHRLAAR